MYHRDYTQELGLPSPHKLLPLTAALPILAAVILGAGFGAFALADYQRVRSTELAARLQLQAKEHALQAARLAQARTTALSQRR